MTQTKLPLVFFVSLALSAVATASPITIATSSYGRAKSGGVMCGGSCDLPAGVTVLEQSYSGRGGEVYDFAISSLPPGITGFDFTLTGSAPLASTSDYGSFVCSDLPKRTKTQCGANPTDVTTTTNAVTTTQSYGRRKKRTKTVTSATSVTFTVDGNNKDLVFYAIYFPNAVINADLTFHPANLVVPQTIAFQSQVLLPTPEPRLLSLVTLSVFMLGLAYFRRRQYAGANKLD